MLILLQTSFDLEFLSHMQDRNIFLLFVNMLTMHLMEIFRLFKFIILIYFFFDPSHFLILRYLL